MKRFNILSLAMLVALLACALSISQLSYTFSSLVNNVYEKPSYSLGFIEQNSILNVRLQILDAASAFTISSPLIQVQLLNSVNTPPAVHQFDLTSCAALICSLSFQVAASDFYYLTIFSDDAQVFDYYTRFNLQASIGNEQLLALTDVFRHTVYKYFYVNSTVNATFSLYPVPNPISSSITIISLTNRYQFSANIQNVEGILASRKQEYSAQLAPGFYALAVIVDPASAVRISYPTDPYLCPYTAQFPDYYSAFLGCIMPLSQSGLPCTNYNSQTGVCTDCIHKYYILNGKCIANTTCENRYYYSYDVCLNVSSLCGDYDIYTGHCLSCVNASYILSGGICNRISVTCAANQYQINYLCYNVSAGCNTFDPNTGNCLTCIPNYSLISVICIPTPIICSPGQYVNVNRVCQRVPSECNNFDYTNLVCRVCIRGYYINNGVCQVIICPPRHVPSKYSIFCVSVDLLCATYDNMTGACLTCDRSDYIIGVNGDCIQSKSPLAGCQERQQLGFGQCVGVQDNCEVYNLRTLNCDKCHNKYYLDYRGLCELRAVCHQGQWSFNGRCITLPINCLAVNEFGLCTICVNNIQYRLQQGQCMFFKNCLTGQFLNIYGSCVTLNSTCDQYNPTDGSCVSCKNKKTQPRLGVCCPVGQTFDGANCVNSAKFELASNNQQGARCKRFHPTTKYCISCNKGYTIDPITMNTCKKI